MFALGLKLDPMRTYQTGKKIINDFLQLKEIPAEEIAQLNNKLEKNSWIIKLTEDLLAQMGDEVWFGIGLPKHGGFIPDVLCCFPIKDAAKVADCFERLAAEYLGGQVKIAQRRLKERPFFVCTIKAAPVSPSVVVLEDKVLIGLFPRTIKKCLQKEREPLHRTQVYKDALASVGLKSTSATSMFWYLNVKASLSYLVDTFISIVPGFFPEKLPGGFDLALLPSTEAVMKPFHVSAGTICRHQTGMTFTVSVPITQLSALFLPLLFVD